LAQQALGEFAACEVALSAPVRSIVQDAQPLTANVMSENEIAARYPVRSHEEHRQGRLLSFFIPDTVHNRHVVLRDKEREVPRRHGTLLRTGQSMLPDEATMCVTGWMHGVFGAQLTLGNTSFHKLFSVSRDPYNITRASGLRIMAEIGAEWRLLAVPSAFDIGLSDCRWIYRLDDRTITVHAVAAGDEPALQWQITVEGEPCRFLVFGHLVLGERELDHVGGIEIDATGNEITFRPDPASIFGQRYRMPSIISPSAHAIRSKRWAAMNCSTPTVARVAAATWPYRPARPAYSVLPWWGRCGTRRRQSFWQRSTRAVPPARKCWRLRRATGMA
jgi:1,2-beta-oligoglucan phosphorylase